MFNLRLEHQKIHICYVLITHICISNAKPHHIKNVVSSASNSPNPSKDKLIIFIHPKTKKPPVYTTNLS